MHRKPHANDDGRMEEGRGTDDARQDFVLCQCGCETPVFKNKWGYQGRWVNGHHITGRSREQWREMYENLVANAPLCQCGCGQSVRPFAKSVDDYIAKHGSRRYSRFVKGHHRRKIPASVELTSDEKMAILGTLLGDSSIGFAHSHSSNPRLSANHSTKQMEWAQWKAAALTRLGSRLTIARNDGYGDNIVRLSTSSMPCLHEIYRLVKKDGNRKHVTMEWLEEIGEIGLAWWIGDDGSCSGRSMRIHTEGFSLTENNTIASWFSKTFGKATVHRTNRGHYYICLSADAQRAILPIISSHLPESLQYKLESSRVCSGVSKRGSIRHNR